ncbi:MAG: dienelactone hydrolase [Rhodospirillales bacterium]|nr:dienelactone hydrolase [Rhodospirillales bacterium]
MKIQDIDYHDDSLRLRGVLAYDGEIEGERPGIVVVHEAWGLGDHAIARAKMLAELGYVALAADMYGDRRQAADLPAAMELIGDLRTNPEKLRARAGAAVATLKAQRNVDSSRVAAIGFCFGGTTVLELARGGADLKGVVSFHGGLQTAAPAKPGAVTPKVLVCTGADDPMIPPSQVIEFEDEMRNAAADWQVICYGGTVHSFTNPNAGKGVALEGLAYNQQSDRRSWAAMRAFFDEIFAGN